jgi:hypothetical protein
MSRKQKNIMRGFIKTVALIIVLAFVEFFFSIPVLSVPAGMVQAAIEASLSGIAALIATIAAIVIPLCLIAFFLD